MAAERITSLGALFVRLFWMVLGPAVLFVLACNIGSGPYGWLTGTDFAYLVVLALMLGARWLDYRGGGQTAAGEPMTEADLRGYVVGALVVGLVVWAGANVVGNHWLAR